MEFNMHQLLSLNNLSTTAVIAYYANDYIEGNQDIRQFSGFIAPMKFTSITFSYWKDSVGSPFPDSIHIKGLPLDEEQINESNINEFESQISKMFHSENVRLMFTVDSLSIELVNEIKHIETSQLKKKNVSVVKSFWNNRWDVGSQSTFYD